MKNLFGKLFIKELKDLRFSILVLSMIIISWEFFLYTRRFYWPNDLIFGLSWVPFVFLPFILFWKGINSFRSEWKDDTIYGLLMLPVSGMSLTGSKIAAHLLEFIWLIALTIGGVFIHSRPVIDLYLSTVPTEVVGKIYLVIFYIGLGYLLVNGILYLTGQFSYLVGRVFSRFQGIITALFLFWSQWFVIRMGGILSRLLSWLPEIRVDLSFQNQWGGVTQATPSLESAPIVAVLIMGLVLYLAASWLIENQLEV